jgi:hypothetical protein
MTEEELRLDELRTAAAMCGPRDHSPPYVRQPFPTVALPRVLRTFATDAAAALGVPIECIAMPMIATCAASIGATCRIAITPTWSEPAVLWAVTLMDSGSLKTPAYNAAMAPLRAAQRLAEEDHARRLAEFKKGQNGGPLGDYAGEGGPGGDATVTPPQGGEEPVPVDYYTSDSTVEALALLFARNPRGLALTRDELSGFFASFGAYKGGRGGDEAAYLEFYNAGSVKLNRASGKRIFVNVAALSIFGTCQPTVFVDAIGAKGRNANQVENGLAARFLIACPPSSVKRWQEPKSFESRHYQSLIADLLSIPLQLDADGRAEPAMIRMTAEANAAFATFVNEHGEQTAAISNAALRYHYAKLEAVAARMALIFYLCDGATHDLGSQPHIQTRHVLAGIAVARWCGREALRVYDGYVSAAEQEKQQLLEEIRAHGGVISPWEMRRLRRRWADPMAAEMVLRSLARAGWGTLAVEEPGPKGGRPALRFRLHNMDTPDTATQSAETPDFREVHEGEGSPRSEV